MEKRNLLIKRIINQSKKNMKLGSSALLWDDDQRKRRYSAAGTQLKVNNIKNRKRCEIRSKLTIIARERCH